MPATDLLKEAGRVMVICNACRYCEGICAVFPAMELRRTFSDGDLKYLANLCHDCRGCYYACQYAPPHEFDLNVPQTFAELRLDTYREFTWPAFLAGLFRRNRLWVSLVTVLSVAIVLVMTIAVQGTAVVFSAHVGESAFYRVIPYLFMVLPFSAIGFCFLVSLLIGVIRFWRETGLKPNQMADPRANLRALRDVLRLTHLDGGGYGCNYPDDRFSLIRRRFHHFVFYGFMLCFIATAVAAFYDHFLHLSAPYPFWSWPVILGTVGGVALLVGAMGLLYLKRQMDTVPAAPGTYGMDVSFIVLLVLISLSGLLLLALRTTPAMGTLLAVHLGFVAGLFLMLPYGKFVHAVYRYAALVRNAQEQSRDNRQH